MKLLVQFVVFVLMLVILCQLPVFFVLYRFSNESVLPGFEKPIRALEVFVRILQGNSPIWYRAASGGLVILDLLVLIGLAAYPAHLVTRSRPTGPSKEK